MSLPPEAIVEAGKVAMVYKRTVARLLVTCGRPGGASVSTVFICQANIVLAWVDPVDVPCMLAVKGGCCGNKKKPGVIGFASEDQVRRWTNKGGR